MLLMLFDILVILSDNTDPFDRSFSVISLSDIINIVASRITTESLKIYWSVAKARDLRVCL